MSLEFTEQRRYEYELSENSVVMDLGLFQGNFSKIIYEKYHCNLYSFEPISRFFLESKNNLKKYSKINCFNYGIGDSEREETIAVRNDSSSIYLESDEKETIKIRSIKNILNELNLNRVDLIKINIEGCEFELLEFILKEGLVNVFKNIQVQFHTVVPNAIERREKIRTELSKTHHLTYDCYFIWENWRTDDYS